MTAIKTSIDTPCIRVCTLHPVSRLCAGCGRTLDEIAGWIAFDGKERARIMAQLPDRLAAMSGAAVAPAA
jgi:predicted Fe-S protein YdhL (DUF1289 family)